VVDLLAEMAQARLAWLDPRVRSWYDDGQLLVQLASALESEARRVGDADFGAGFRHDAGGAAGDPLDWANRRIDLASGGWAVTGIRFRGLDPDRPFVDLIATSEPPTPDGLAAVGASVVPGYAPFGPRCLRVEVFDPAALVARLETDARFGQRCGIDMHLVAGRVDELLARPRAPAFDQVALRPGAADRLATLVADVYSGLAARNPDVLVWATPESADSLADCESEGLLFEVFAGADTAGVVAAIRDDDHGMRGFSVQEICLDDRYRGRRLAAGVMQHLLERLPAEAGDVLWGTIHPHNTASLRNARSIGRQLVGGYAWITPAALPGMQ
jgi:ribosomal protein S18 acetylase RimI-like enzyme